MWRKDEAPHMNIWQCASFEVNQNFGIRIHSHKDFKTFFIIFLLLLPLFGFGRSWWKLHFCIFSYIPVPRTIMQMQRIALPCLLLIFMVHRRENFISLYDIYAVGVAVTTPWARLHTWTFLVMAACVCSVQTAFWKYEASPPLLHSPHIHTVLHTIHTNEINHVKYFHVE